MQFLLYTSAIVVCRFLSAEPYASLSTHGRARFELHVQKIKQFTPYLSVRREIDDPILEFVYK